MRLLSLLALGLATAVLTSTPAKALEPFKIYDRFDEKPLDPTRWGDSERVREIKGGAMRLMQRGWGATDPNGTGGVTFQNWFTNLANPQSITELRARVNVTAIEANGCPSSPVQAFPEARILGTFFNVGTPTPGSFDGDALAMVLISRSSFSTDPPGVLRVNGLLAICRGAECNNIDFTGGGFVDLGTVQVGTPAVLTLQWDRGGKTFYFSRDGGTHSASLAYTYSDTSPPGLPAKSLNTRLDLPSCSPQVSSMIDARFDNVRVNQSALP